MTTDALPLGWVGAHVEEAWCPDYHYPFWYASVTERTDISRFPIIHECVHRHRSEATARKCLSKLMRRFFYDGPAPSSTTDTGRERCVTV